MKISLKCLLSIMSEVSGVITNGVPLKPLLANETEIEDYDGIFLWLTKCDNGDFEHEFQFSVKENEEIFIDCKKSTVFLVDSITGETLDLLLLSPIQSESLEEIIKNFYSELDDQEYKDMKRADLRS